MERLGDDWESVALHSKTTCRRDWSIRVYCSVHNIFFPEKNKQQRNWYCWWLKTGESDTPYEVTRWWFFEYSGAFEVWWVKFCWPVSLVQTRSPGNQWRFCEFHSSSVKMHKNSNTNGWIPKTSQNNGLEKVSMLDLFGHLWFPSQWIHVWNMYLHLADLYGRCMSIYHTWIFWALNTRQFVGINSLDFWGVMFERKGMETSKPERSDQSSPRRCPSWTRSYRREKQRFEWFLLIWICF